MGSCYPVLQLGYDSVTAGSQVHPLGVDISSDLSLDQHVSQVNAIYFYWPHQLQQIWRSMDPVSIASLVVTIRIDYCTFANVPKTSYSTY